MIRCMVHLVHSFNDCRWTFELARDHYKSYWAPWAELNGLSEAIKLQKSLFGAL